MQCLKNYGYEINEIGYNGRNSEIDIRKPDSFWSSNIKFFIDKREPTFVVYCQETAGHIDRKLWRAINEKVKELRLGGIVMEHIKCWLCEEIKNGGYKMENTNKTIRLSIYKEKSGQSIIQAFGEDVLQQEISYCPICGKKLEE